MNTLTPEHLNTLIPPYPMNLPDPNNQKMIVIKKDDLTPTIVLDSANGKIEINGCCAPLYANEFFQPLFEWAQSYVANPRHQTVLHIYINNLNRSSKTGLHRFISQLAEVMQNGFKFEITWFIDEGDQDILEYVYHLSKTTNLVIAIERK